MLFGNVVIGSGVMIATGILNDVIASLQVSVTRAGQLISVSALIVCLGAPFLAAWVAGWDRKKLLSWSLVWYGFWHAMAAVAPGFSSLLACRMLAMLAAAIFTPQAASCIALLVPEHQRGRAITFVFLGWSVASVIGIPLGAWIGGVWGWRWSMALISALSFVGALWLWRRMPERVVPPALSAAAWRQTLSSRTLLVTLSVTVMSAAGQFILFSYLAPYVTTRFSTSPAQFSALLLGYGAMGFVGNALLSRHIERVGTPRAVLMALMCIATGMLLTPWTTSWIAMGLALLPWGLGVFASNSAQQARLVVQAPWLASASVALNTSAIYAGQALGATIGGAVIVHQGLIALPHFSLMGMLVAMGLSALATRYARLHPLPRPG
ncbi:MFS transporter [Limnohabitans sp. T6-5]|uniref:MFS transporter n=1 Tax=Limnohabitans sp. T6-5 TaxID=1100724 RepID=UPI000D3D42BD|nr:MFS transporter [Limnohabitans sp. T6-5]PUE07052.1 MFS transporter [Limnohabitans sp. T6-5]